MADGYYTSWQNFRCGVCQKFFNSNGVGKIWWGATLTCPHCNAELSEEPCDDYFACSGVFSPGIVGTGIIHMPSGVWGGPIMGSGI